MTGSVHIANVSAQTSGLYRCSVTNPLGTQHCYINLSVYTRKSFCASMLIHCNCIDKSDQNSLQNLFCVVWKKKCKWVMTDFLFLMTIQLQIIPQESCRGCCWVSLWPCSCWLWWCWCCGSTVRHRRANGGSAMRKMSAIMRSNTHPLSLNALLSETRTGSHSWIISALISMYSFCQTRAKERSYKILGEQWC